MTSVVCPSLGEAVMLVHSLSNGCMDWSHKTLLSYSVNAKALIGAPPAHNLLTTLPDPTGHLCVHRDYQWSMAHLLAYKC